jgi:hypothetical protein
MSLTPRSLPPTTNSFAPSRNRFERLDTWLAKAPRAKQGLFTAGVAASCFLFGLMAVRAVIAHPPVASPAAAAAAPVPLVARMQPPQPADSVPVTSLPEEPVQAPASPPIPSAKAKKKQLTPVPVAALSAPAPARRRIIDDGF